MISVMSPFAPCGACQPSSGFGADDGFAGELVLLRAGPAEEPDHPVVGEQLGLGITVLLVGGADVLGEDILDGVLVGVHQVFSVRVVRVVVILAPRFSVSVTGVRSTMSAS